MRRCDEGWTITRLLTCLAVSAGLHAGLGLAGWSAPERPVQVSSHPLQVSLCELTVVASPANTSMIAASPPRKTVRQTAATAVTPRPAPIRPQEPQPPRQPEALPAARTEQVVCKAEPVDMVSLSSDAAARPTASFEAADSAAVASDAAPAEVATANPVARLDLTGRPGPDALPMSLNGSEDGVDGSGFTDAQPIYQSNPLPVYPRLARQKHWEGLVWLRVTVSPQGQVTDLEVEESSGHRVLDQAARRAVLGWRFVPARHGEQAVAARVRIPVRFRLDEG